MRSNKLLISVLLAAVALTSVTALGFEAYFSDAAGHPIDEVWEGRSVHVAVEDPFKAACGIDSFRARVLIFDYKTGAYMDVEAMFVETGYDKGIFLWDRSAVSVGDRRVWQPITYEYPYQIGDRWMTEMIALGFEHTLGHPDWQEGNWEYVDLDVAPVAGAIGGADTFGAGNNTGIAKRYQFIDEIGRFENNDTLVVLVEDTLDGYWGAGQVKIKRTEANLTTNYEGTDVYYGCADIILTIDDMDESLSCDRPDFVPFFVIVNPGSWNMASVAVEPPDDDLPPGPPDDDPGPPPPPPPSALSAGNEAQQHGVSGPVVKDFCSLFRYGGVDPTRVDGATQLATVLNDPIRWYNIYDMRYIQYPHPDLAAALGLDADDPRLWNWAPAPDQAPSTDNVPESLIAPNGVDDIVRPAGVARAVFYAQETGPETGVFKFNFGSLDQLQERLGFQRFPAGTTIAFYYVDPNDFSDMHVTTIHVASAYTRSNVQITSAPPGYSNVDQVRLGEDGLYFRVEDTKQDMDDCLQESLAVHVCDIHGEDDSEYWKLDEVSAAAGIFAHSGAMPLGPVWDAVGGYQLVLDDQQFQAFNADSIFVRYNSVRYNPDDIALLGSGTGELGAKDHFPPEIIVRDPRYVEDISLPYYPWDVSFDTVKVYDYQVFDGTETTMRLLDGKFNPISTYRPSDQIYIEVTDYDQNENSRLAERISGRWDIPADGRDSSPMWQFGGGGVFDHFMNEQFGRVTSGKVYVFNPRSGRVAAVDLMETGRDTGVFKSTTGITVADLGGMENDIIVAFYQDPSNHHDIAIKSVHVVAGPAVPPDAPTVEFDRAQYSRGDTGTVTVTEPQMAGQPEITGEDVLVITDQGNVAFYTTSTLTAVPGTQNRFQATFEIPTEIATGTIRALYTHPADAERTGEATATVVVPPLEDVTGIDIDPEFLQTEATFTIQAEPVGAVADRITITFYDLTGRKVGEVTDTNTDHVTWDGGNLRSTAYIYVAVVEGPQDRWVFKGPVYIKR